MWIISAKGQAKVLLQIQILGELISHKQTKAESMNKSGVGVGLPLFFINFLIDENRCLKTRHWRK